MKLARRNTMRSGFCFGDSNNGTKLLVCSFLFFYRFSLQLRYTTLISFDLNLVPLVAISPGDELSMSEWSDALVHVTRERRVITLPWSRIDDDSVKRPERFECHCGFSKSVISVFSLTVATTFEARNRWIVLISWRFANELRLQLCKFS